MGDLRLGINLWSQAATGLSFLAAGRRADELGYDHVWTWDHLLADLRRPGPADLRGLHRARGASAQATERIRARACSSARTRSATPGSPSSAIDDHRPHQRRPGDRWASAGRGSSDEHQAFGIDFGSGLRPAPRLAGRGRRRRARTLLDGGEVTSRAGGRYAFDHLRIQPPPVQPHAADDDRRWRRAEDAPDRRPSTPTSGTRSGRPRRSPTRTRSCARTARRSAGTRRPSSGRVGCKITIRGHRRRRRSASGGRSLEHNRTPLGAGRRRRTVLDRDARADRRDDARATGGRASTRSSSSSPRPTMPRRWTTLIQRREADGRRRAGVRRDGSAPDVVRGPAGRGRPGEPARSPEAGLVSLASRQRERLGSPPAPS